jgi:hypothetical protein
MKPLGLASQIFAIGLAVAIVWFFVRPTFAEIGDLQNEIQQYTQERERVTETNVNLAALVSTLETIEVADRMRLVTYMPTFLDEIAVLRDLTTIADITGVNYTAIKYNGEFLDTSEESRIATEIQTVTAHTFSISVEGTYARIKDFFSLLEQNQYPLQISNLNIKALDGGFLQADAIVVTYVNDSNEVEIR